jgi:glycosyltransferase involved in cell wall biosynthesis
LKERPALSDRPLAFSLIVCTVDRIDPLKRLLDSLLDQAGSRFEVIIVDQNETPILEPLLASYGSLELRRVTSARGLSRARNAGMAVARNDVIAFPDDDCWYTPGLLVQVAAAMAATPDVQIFSARTVDTAGRPSVSPTMDRPAAISRSNFLLCGNSNTLFFRRDAATRIGLFDERLGVGSGTLFGSGEEADYLLRALAKGFVARYEPALHVLHDQVDEVITSRTIERARLYGAGFGALMRKHRLGAWYLAYRQLRTLTRCILLLAKGDVQRARYRWQWLRGMGLGYRQWPGSPA